MKKEMYKVIMRGGSVKHDVMTDVSYEEALWFCEHENWIHDEGFVWDLEIEEM